MTTVGASSMNHSSSSRRRRSRRGYTLAFFAMFMFALFGLAALVIDLGFVRLARRQMQTAVDAAAIEGLRHTHETDEQWRQRASDMVAWTFDDDFDPDNGDPFQFGAGPVVTFSGGIGKPEMAAGQLMTVSEDRNQRVYKPRRSDNTAGLELNDDNEAYGDIVRVDSATVRVQMRRVAQPDVSPDDNIPGVSSSGPGVPWLAGRGAFLSAASRDRLQHGVTVRAAASASAGAARSVGPVLPEGTYTDANGDPLPGVPGLAPWALELNFWNGLPAGDADGELSIEGDQLKNDDAVVGRSLVASQYGVLSIGEVLLTPAPYAEPPQPSLNPHDADPTLARYIPIYCAELDNRIVGFGYVLWDIEDDTLTIARRANVIARVNAGRYFAPHAFRDGNIPLPSETLTRIWQEHLTLPAPLQIPLLVR